MATKGEVHAPARAAFEGAYAESASIPMSALRELMKTKVPLPLLRMYGRNDLVTLTLPK